MKANKKFMDNEDADSTDIVIGVICIAVVFLLIAAILVGWPLYNVWSKEKKGQAALKESEWSKQIAIEEAKAKKESAGLLAEAEIERAKGVAEANKIIGESLKNNDAYLRYLWIQGLQDGSSEIIYIPTEANLPILEATRSLEQ